MIVCAHCRGRTRYNWKRVLKLFDRKPYKFFKLKHYFSIITINSTVLIQVMLTFIVAFPLTGTTLGRSNIILGVFKFSPTTETKVTII